MEFTRTKYHLLILCASVFWYLTVLIGPMTSDCKTEAELARLRFENRQLKHENASLRRRLGLSEQQESEDLANQEQPPTITRTSDVQEKIKLFRRLFRGRDDVYPLRWENRQGRAGYSPACGNEWHKTLCGKPKVKCGACKNSRFLPVTDQVNHDHLIGKHTIGVYPILSDGSCWFLAIDFDKSTWRDDARVFHDSCRHFDIPAYVECSRSGEGAHVWIFFSHSMPTALARKLGTLILTHATDQRPGIGLESYDRFFPSQDTLPKGGFGNLIALPLQKLPREQGNSEFLDEALQPIEDQWAHLASVQRITQRQIENLINGRDTSDNLLGVQRVSTLDEALEDPWTLPSPSRDHGPQIIGEMPDQAGLTLSNSLYIEKDGLPPALQNRLIRLAAFQNPEFYRAQAMRMSTYGKPRLISCARGDMENRIKENQLDMFADRTSCQHWWPNQFRLLLASLAYTLIEAIRRIALQGTELAQAYVGTIRLKLFKIGAVILKNSRRVRFLLASGCPYKDLYFLVANRLAPG